MAKQSTTTVVLHDAHVAARAAAGAAAGAAFMAAYQGVCCFIAAVAITCVARRAARADRAATRAANHAAAKAVRAAKASRKEAAEQYASRVARRAAAKLAAAPAVSAAKKAAAAVAKLLKAANATRLAAVRAQRMAAKATATIEAATTRAANHAAATTVGTRATVVVRSTRSTTADKRAAKAAVVAFLAQTPCLAALWFYATLNVADKAANKEAAKIANRAYARVKAPRVPMNDAEKRAEITLACANARAANVAKAKEEAAQKAKEEAAQMASGGNTLSAITMAARSAQASAQKAVNAVRKLQAMLVPKKAKVDNEKNIITGIISVKADNASISQRDSWHKLTHVTKSSTKNKIVNAKDEFKTFAKVKEEKQKDSSIAKAKKAAMRQKWIELRKEKIARICAKAWMEKGIWVDSFLAEACNDSDYAIREQSYRELLALVGEVA